MTEQAGQRILFASEAGWGHVTPLITIAGELAARGVGDIWFAAIDRHKAAIEAMRADVDMNSGGLVGERAILLDCADDALE